MEKNVIYTFYTEAYRSLEKKKNHKLISSDDNTGICFNISIFLIIIDLFEYMGMHGLKTPSLVFLVPLFFWSVSASDNCPTHTSEAISDENLPLCRGYVLGNDTGLDLG